MTDEVELITIRLPTLNQTVQLSRDASARIWNAVKHGEAPSAEEYVNEMLERFLMKEELKLRDNPPVENALPPHAAHCAATAFDDVPASDWSQCPNVESASGNPDGPWVLKGTQIPVSAVFEQLKTGATIDDIKQQLKVDGELLKGVMQFVVRSLDKPPGYVP